MKRNEMNDLHNLTIEQLQGELQTTERKLLDLRFDNGLNRLTNTAGLHNTRKRIAVIKTLIREKELLATSGFATMDEYKAFKVTERKVFRQARKA